MDFGAYLLLILGFEPLFGFFVVILKFKKVMKYYITKTVNNLNMEDAENLVRTKLQEQGFGVVTEINMQATLRAKIGKDIQPYKILGACNPAYAFKAVSAEDKIGVMLPCNVCLQQINDTSIEVFAVNPMVAMESINNDEVALLAKEITTKLEAVLAAI